MEKLLKRKQQFNDAYYEAKKELPGLFLRYLAVQDRDYYLYALVEYEDNFGREGIINLWAFYQYWQQEHLPLHFLTLTLAHDLLKRGNPDELPRTDGYMYKIYDFELKTSTDEKNG